MQSFKKSIAVSYTLQGLHQTKELTNIEFWYHIYRAPHAYAKSVTSGKWRKLKMSNL